MGQQNFWGLRIFSLTELTSSVTRIYRFGKSSNRAEVVKEGAAPPRQRKRPKPPLYGAFHTPHGVD